MKKLAIVVITSAAIVGATALPAAAANSYTGNVFANGWDGTQYKIGLASFADRWFYMLPSSQIYGCSSIGIPQAALISTTSLVKLKDNFKKVRLDYFTNYRDTITCV